MHNIILFDTDSRARLLPLTATRPISELRIGILTLREKWERKLNAQVSYITQDYLSPKYPLIVGETNLIIAGDLFPTPSLLQEISTLRINEALLDIDHSLIAALIDEHQMEALVHSTEISEIEGNIISATVELRRIQNLWDMTYLNDIALKEDFEVLTYGKKSLALPNHCKHIGDYPLFIEQGAQVFCSNFNTTLGPIYIGRNAEVMENSSIRGPVAICAGAQVKMAAKIYGPTTIGPNCRVGGEVARSIMNSNSNKGHDGFLGDSVLGEWCNIGADSNNSNLKNNYADVKLWSYPSERFEPTGKQFIGLFMGDHAKCGINTMFNTGTVVGVFANVYGSGYPRNFIPDFSWGGGEAGYRTYRFDEACKTAETVMSRRGVQFNDLEKSILYNVYDQTFIYRGWEKSNV
jgi:UDP-N-acetylglucosamine diphosphorylase/glucosamine-1-phosphate N-acetyltransferase